MSFSSDLRAELARLHSSRRKMQETELAVLLRNLCRISPAADGGTCLTFQSGNSDAVKKCFTLIVKTVNIEASLYGLSYSAIREKAKAGERAEGEPPAETRAAGQRAAGAEKVVLPRPFTDLVRRLELVGEDGTDSHSDGVIASVLTQGERARAYLRGMFLCTGFMSDPAGKYHLEFRCWSGPQAEQLREVLSGSSIRSGLTRRKSYFIVYIKDSEDIVMLLHLMGASVSLMATENARIYKEMRNNVNRRVNCETANIGKTVESAVRQREDIKLLRERGILQTLPVMLREAARLREEYPGASLTELGELSDPPVGRSGMNHRLRKLSSLAEKARSSG